MNAQDLRTLAESDDLIAIGKTAVVLHLDMMRSNRMSIPTINTGLVIADADGEPSPVIRASIAQAIKIALKAIANEVEERERPT